MNKNEDNLNTNVLLHISAINAYNVNKVPLDTIVSIHTSAVSCVMPNESAKVRKIWKKQKHAK